MEHVTQKQKDIQDLLYYQFSSEDIDKVMLRVLLRSYGF